MFALIVIAMACVLLWGFSDGVSFVSFPDELHLVPSLCVRRGNCGTPSCKARHLGIFLTFLKWGVVLHYIGAEGH